MNYQKIDKAFFAFFQSTVNIVGSLGIRLIVLINLTIFIGITSQALQVFFLYMSGEGVIDIFLLSFPSLLILLYFYHVIKKTRKGIAINLDIMRLLSFIFTSIVILSFLFFCSLGVLFKPTYFQEHIYKFLARTAYVVACVSFVCFFYIISCNDNKNKFQKKQIKS